MNRFIDMDCAEGLMVARCKNLTVILAQVRKSQKGGEIALTHFSPTYNRVDIDSAEMISASTKERRDNEV